MPVPERFLSVAEKLRELGATNIEIAYVWDRTADGGYNDDYRIHEALKEINPKLAERFFREMRIKVWRTDMRKEHFNRRRIVQSLLRETKISRGLAEKIAKEVEEKIRSTDVSVITAPLIRELVLARLIEMGLLDEYTRYMRLGIPVYDLEKAMEKGDVEKETLDTILTQYVLFEVLPREATELYLDGAWEIKGIARPNKAFARAFVLRTPNVKTWLKGLIKYLKGEDYIDTPSIYVPRNAWEDAGARAVLEAIKDDVILWTKEDVDGIQRSEVPIYSFGPHDSKVIGDVVEINLDRIAQNAAGLKDVERAIETIKKGVDAYVEFKGKLVKKAEFPIIVKGMDTAAEALVTEREKIEEIVEPLRPFKTL